MRYHLFRFLAVSFVSFVFFIFQSKLELTMPKLLVTSLAFLKELVRPVKYFKRIVGCKYSGLVFGSNYYINTFMECLVMTNYICLIVLLKLGAHLLVRYNIATSFLNSLQIIEPELWEYVWVLMVATFQFIGSLALLFYSTALMKLYCIGIYISIGPLIWPFFKYYDQVKMILTSLTPPASSGYMELLWQTTEYIPFISTQNTQQQQVQLWQGFPVGILVYEFLVTTIAIHLSSGYYGLKLVDLFMEYNYLARVENTNVSIRKNSCI
ncbi:hypothetical protein ILUMI_19245 [Ignelater luminosus]|uniref:Uncharacterized protein n=1 Tax=Ignelater luminosus TaxID=2038154 RepID=A0A8K0CGJ4_IGNLU|nr:hypothetical protein ILUMI_19245 [Ignelater luminosus]